MKERQLKAVNKSLTELNISMTPGLIPEIGWYPQTLDDLDLIGKTLIENNETKGSDSL